MLLVNPSGALAQSGYATRAADLERLRDEIKQVQAGLEQERRRQTRLTRETRQLDEQVARAGRRLHELDAELNRLTARVAQLERDHAGQADKLAQHRRLLAEQLVDAYAGGREEYLRLLLNQQDPDEIDRMLVYYEYLNKARSERIQVAAEEIKRLRALEAELEREAQALAEARREQQREQARLEAARAERRQLLARVEGEIASRAQRLEQMRRDEAQLVELLEGLQRALADIPDQALGNLSFRQSRGRLGWPLEGELAARFGTSRGVGDSRWNGILIEPGRTDQVRAVSHGRVVFADWLRGFGLMVIIDHGDGFMTLYGHNEALYHETGAWVEPGEVIASVGASGGRRNPGLYFEIRSGGKPVDPLPWLRKPG